MKNTVEWFCDELNARWPGKYTDLELEKFWGMVRDHLPADVSWALDEHTKSKPFKAKPNDILPRLAELSRRRERSTTALRDEPSLAVLLGRQMNRPPAEAVLIHFRREWARYAVRAAERERGLTDARAHAFWQRQRDGYLSKCRSTCVACLVSLDADHDEAAAFACGIGSEQADFDALLDLVCTRGLTRAARIEMKNDLRSPIFTEPVAPPSSWASLRDLAIASRADF